MDVLPGPDGVRVLLDPPAFLLVTAGQVLLFDGGDAVRVLWRTPGDRSETAPGR